MRISHLLWHHMSYRLKSLKGVIEVVIHGGLYRDYYRAYYGGPKSLDYSSHVLMKGGPSCPIRQFTSNGCASIRLLLNKFGVLQRALYALMKKGTLHVTGFRQMVFKCIP